MHTIWDWTNPIWNWTNPILTVFGFLIGIWGVRLALKAQKAGRELAEENRDQLSSLRELAKETSDQLSRLHTLSESLSTTVQTRAIGHFPDNLRAIVELIGNTKKRLVIATDVASYGQLSNPDECARYHAALVDRAARSVDVE